MPSGRLPVQINRKLAVLVAVPLGVAAVGASAQTLSKEELASRLNGVEAKDISESPVQGVYQVAIGANVAYVTNDGRYIIRGDIFDAETSTSSKRSYTVPDAGHHRVLRTRRVFWLPWLSR